MRIVEVIAHLFHPRRSNNHRPKILHASSLFSLALIAVGMVALISQKVVLQTVTGGVLGYASDITAEQVVSQTNMERMKAGLAPLKVNELLNAAAQLKAKDMLERQYWAHNSPDGVEPWFFFKKAGYAYQSAGENLARDFMNTSDMLTAWMSSPTHKANILQPKYEEIGVAVVNGMFQGVETTLVVQHFGKPKLTPAIIPDSGAAAEAPVERAERNETLNFIIPASPTVLAQQDSAADARTPLASPLRLVKYIFAAILCMLIAALAYDSYIIEKKNVSRMVGKNMAHILFLLVVIVLLIWVKGGSVLSGATI